MVQQLGSASNSSSILLCCRALHPDDNGFGLSACLCLLHLAAFTHEGTFRCTKCTHFQRFSLLLATFDVAFRRIAVEACWHARGLRYTSGTHKAVTHILFYISFYIPGTYNLSVPGGVSHLLMRGLTSDRLLSHKA